MIRTSALPVRWWYTTLLEGSEGEQLESESAILATQNIPKSSNERFLSSYTSSVIRTKVRSSLVEAVVVVDVPASSGVRLDSLSDYIAFVALSKIRISEAFSGAPSILSLFEADAAGKDRLTAWDNAYLKGLYSVSNSRLASVQRQLIVQRIVNDVK